MTPTLFSVSYAGLWGQHQLDLPRFFQKAAELGYPAVELMGKRPHLSVVDTDQQQIVAIREAAEAAGVVFGMQFHALQKMLTGHVGKFWKSIETDYPNSVDQIQLADRIERYDNATVLPSVEFSAVPPLPRTWFIHRDGTAIIQLQRDRFHHNWRKVKAEDAYPHYGTVLESYKSNLQAFESFLDSNQLGSIQPSQYELTYVNHVPAGDSWSSLADIGNIFPDFSWRNHDRFLPTAESLSWATVFRLPEETGRLHVSIRHAVKPSGSSFLMLELTARGFPRDESRESMWSWFDTAHQWIVNAFADLTHDGIRRETWRQK